MFSFPQLLAKCHVGSSGYHFNEILKVDKSCQCPPALEYTHGNFIPRHTLKIISDLNAAFYLLLSKIVSFEGTKIEPATSLDSIQNDIRIFMHIRKTVVGAAPFWDKTWIFSYQICPHVLFTAYINSPLF